MSDRLSVILTRLRERFTAAADVSEVEAYLSSQGFDRGQIGTIVSAFLSDVQGRSSWAAPRPFSAAMRVQGPHEAGRFAPDAWGYLLALRVSGALSGRDLEDVIDRALNHGEGRISLEDIRAALESSGVEPGPPGFGNGTVH